MFEEFDDIKDPSAPAAAEKRGTRGPLRAVRSPSRLVARLFAAADMPLRARLLACLTKPLGALSLAGVAAGAFAWTLRRGAVVADAAVDLDRVGSVTSDQVLELAHFTGQVSPQALQDFASLVEASHLGLAPFSASALLLLVAALRSAPGEATLPRDG